MRLAELLRHVDPVAVHGSLDVDVQLVTRDSREAGSGVAWVAVRGGTVDGHDFAGKVRAGVAVLERDVHCGAEAVVIVREAREALARLAAALEGHPARVLPVIGVTGTNGKTTVTTLCARAMEATGRRAGRVGTLGAVWGEVAVQTGLTTPEAPDLQRLLGRMRDADVGAAFIEASSIALDQRRLDALPFHTAVFTNLTRDHLDFHGSMDAYARSKAQLFHPAHLRRAGGPPRALLNGDDPAWRQMYAPDDRWLVGFGEECDVRIVDVQASSAGQRVEVRVPDGGVVLIDSAMVGRFNAWNLACALAMLRTVGLGWQEAATGLSRVPSVPGRLEPVVNDRGLTVLVDYAHTPDALRVALEAVRPLATGRVIVVFGCGGDRDPGKRPDMGAVAEAGADVVWVTSDNPRSEDPQQIVDQVLAGVAAPDAVRVQVDRATALASALADAAPGDVVLIAGKGHETYQEVGGERRDFDDRLVARQAMEEP